MHGPDRHRPRTDAEAFALGLLALAGLYIGLDIMMNLDEFMKTPGGTPGMLRGMGRYYLARMPRILAPIGVVAAVALTAVAARTSRPGPRP